MIEKINRRTKKAILNSVQKLISKYGVDSVRLIINKYFEQIREKKKLEEEVQSRERELLRLRKRLGN